MRALTMANIETMDGLAFERYVASLLKNEGYTNISMTEKYDMGVDIIATRNGIRWGIQVKRYSNMVKAEAVRQVVTALNTYHCERAMVVTNSYYSRPALQLAASNNCVLVDHNTLSEWVMRFQRSNASTTKDIAIKAPFHTS
jgi:restriction system protein